MRTISQNSGENHTGVSLWTSEDIQKAQAKEKALALELEQQNQPANVNDDEEYGDGGFTDQMLVDLDI